MNYNTEGKSTLLNFLCALCAALSSHPNSELKHKCWSVRGKIGRLPPLAILSSIFTTVINNYIWCLILIYCFIKAPKLIVQYLTSKCCYNVLSQDDGNILCSVCPNVSSPFTSVLANLVSQPRRLFSSMKSSRLESPTLLSLFSV